MSESPEKRRRGIESLLTERKKYESWIAQLDAKRATTAEHVFIRVHADYATRLEDVRSRLGNEADGIRTIVAELATRLATEQRLVTEKSDELAEAALRASVGEFSDKEWASTKGKLDAAIAAVRSSFDGTERELAELKGVLQSIAAAPAPRTSGVSTPLPALEQAEARPRSSGQQQSVSAAVPRASSAMAQPPAGVTASPAAPTQFDELAFLKSVAGTPITPAKPVAQAARAEPVATEPLAAEPVATQPVVAEPLAAVHVAAVQVAAVQVADQPGMENAIPDVRAPDLPMDDESVEAEPVTSTRGRPSAKVALKEDDAGPLGGPTPRTSQAIRSLKCQECGTLNFPTEWYCERCGGELAAF